MLPFKKGGQPLKDDHQNKQHQSNAQGSEEALSHKTSGKNESEDTLTNRQGHPVTDNQNVRTVGNRGLQHLRTMIFSKRSATSTGNASLSGLFMPGEQVHTGILKRTEASETNRFQHTHGQALSGKRQENTGICPFFNCESWKTLA